MKTYVRTFSIILLVMATVTSCKKSNTPDRKDYTASIKDKTWWGMLANTGKTPEYYSVHFNTDNSLTWSQLSGDNTGHWLLDGKDLTITFDGNSVEIKGSISDDDQLVNIKDNAPAYEINSGELIANSTIPLDNTIWTGTIDYPSTKALQLGFKPGLLVTINIENSPVKTYTYTRSSSSPVVRISTIFFGIVTSVGKMKGSVDNAVVVWQATKQ